MVVSYHHPQCTEDNFGIITPYLIPENSSKKVNAGDGFILDACINLLGRSPRKLYSQWSAITDEQVAEINQYKFLLVAGANILKDDLRITPNFSPNLLNKIKIPVVLMGVGHYGHEEATRNGLSQISKDLLRALTDRFPLISVRCESSQEYLILSDSRLSEKVLMTSCPVLHHQDMPVDRKQASTDKDSGLAVVTLSDRTNYLSQAPLLEFTKRNIKSDRYILSLHQNYQNIELWKYASQLGFEIFHSPSYKDYINLYRAADVHVGNRLHAHLKFIANEKPSYMSHYDLRQVFFAKSIATPLIDPEFSTLPNFDPSAPRQKKLEHWTQMSTFVRTVQTLFE